MDGTMEPKEVFQHVTAVLHPSLKEFVKEGMDDFLLLVEDQSGVDISWSKKKYKITGTLQQISDAETIIKKNLGFFLRSPQQLPKEQEFVSLPQTSNDQMTPIQAPFASMQGFSPYTQQNSNMNYRNPEQAAQMLSPGQNQGPHMQYVEREPSQYQQRSPLNQSGEERQMLQGMNVHCRPSPYQHAQHFPNSGAGNQHFPETPSRQSYQRGAPNFERRGQDPQGTFSPPHQHLGQPEHYQSGEMQSMPSGNMIQQQTPRPQDVPIRPTPKYATNQTQARQHVEEDSDDSMPSLVGGEDTDEEEMSTQTRMPQVVHKQQITKTKGDIHQDYAERKTIRSAPYSETSKSSLRDIDADTQRYNPWQGTVPSPSHMEPNPTKAADRSTQRESRRDKRASREQPENPTPQPTLKKKGSKELVKSDSRSHGHQIAPQTKEELTPEIDFLRSDRKRETSPLRFDSPEPTENRETSPLRFDSPEPTKKRETSPQKFDSPKPATKRETSPMRFDSPEPTKKREASPMRFDSPEPTKKRETSPQRFDSPEPTKKRENSPMRFDSPEPTSKRETSPQRFDSPKPTKKRETSPLRFDSPEPTTKRETSPLRFDSPEPIKKRGPSPQRFDSPEPTIKRETTPQRFDSPEPSQEMGSPKYFSMEPDRLPDAATSPQKFGSHGDQTKRKTSLPTVDSLKTDEMEYYDARETQIPFHGEEDLDTDDMLVRQAAREISPQYVPDAMHQDRHLSNNQSHFRQQDSPLKLSSSEEKFRYSLRLDVKEGMISPAVKSSTNEPMLAKRSSTNDRQNLRVPVYKETPKSELPPHAGTMPREETVMDSDLWDFIQKVHSHEVRKITTDYNVIIDSSSSGSFTTVVVTGQAISSEVMFANEKLAMLHQEAHSKVYIETLSVPRDVTDHLQKQAIREIHGMYHNILVKEGRRPGKLVFLGEEQNVKQAKAELRKMLNLQASGRPPAYARESEQQEKHSNNNDFRSGYQQNQYSDQRGIRGKEITKEELFGKEYASREPLMRDAHVKDLFPKDQREMDLDEIEPEEESKKASSQSTRATERGSVSRFPRDDPSNTSFTKADVPSNPLEVDPRVDAKYDGLLSTSVQRMNELNARVSQPQRSLSSEAQESLESEETPLKRVQGRGDFEEPRVLPRKEQLDEMNPNPSQDSWRDRGARPKDPNMLDFRHDALNSDGSSFEPIKDDADKLSNPSATLVSVASSVHNLKGTPNRSYDREKMSQLHGHQDRHTTQQDDMTDRMTQAMSEMQLHHRDGQLSPPAIGTEDLDVVGSETTTERTFQDNLSAHDRFEHETPPVTSVSDSDVPLGRGCDEITDRVRKEAIEETKRSYTSAGSVSPVDSRELDGERIEAEAKPSAIESSYSKTLLDDLIREGGTENMKLITEILDQQEKMKKGRLGSSSEKPGAGALPGFGVGMWDEKEKDMLDALMKLHKRKREGERKKPASFHSSNSSIVSNAEVADLSIAKDEVFKSFKVLEENSIAYSEFKKRYEDELEKHKPGDNPIPEIALEDDGASGAVEERKYKGKPLKDYPDLKKSFTRPNLDLHKPTPAEDFARLVSDATGEEVSPNDVKMKTDEAESEVPKLTEAKRTETDIAMEPESVMPKTTDLLKMSLRKSQDHHRPLTAEEDFERLVMLASGKSPKGRTMEKCKQPSDGEMSDLVDMKFHLEGFPNYGTRQVTFCFPTGQVMTTHGKKISHSAQTLYAYLPVTKLGDNVHKKMKEAFRLGKLLSVTQCDESSGEINFAVDVKIDPAGEYGYPDKEYLQRVIKQLENLLGA